MFFHHKHCITIESFRLDVLAWNTTMIDFLIHRFGPVVKAVASGLGFEEGHRQLVTLLAELADHPKAGSTGP